MASHKTNFEIEDDGKGNPRVMLVHGDVRVELPMSRIEISYRDGSTVYMFVLEVLANEPRHSVRIVAPASNDRVELGISAGPVIRVGDNLDVSAKCFTKERNVVE